MCYEAATNRLAARRTYPGSLQSCTVGNPANARLNLSYTYESNGNIHQMTDATRSETLTYGYDELDRLTGVSGAYSKNFEYNAIGNLTKKDGTDYTYSTTHKHAVASLSTGENYSYDANGNMTQRVEGGQTYTQTFDAENRLISVTVNSQTTLFNYDGDGNLVKKLKPDGSCTIYPSASLPLRGLRRAGVGGVYEVEKAACGGAVTRTTTYYPAGGAMRVDGTLYFVLKDHLGSANVVTDANGDVVGDQRYYPFGETRVTDGDMLTDRLFTGQHEMAELGIYHYGARFYSQKLGRFLSADTLVPGAGNPQGFNRYSYANNNPVKYIDPSGHAPEPPYVMFIREAIAFFENLGYRVLGDPAIKSIYTNGADLVFRQGRETLAVEVKKVADNIDLGSLAKSARYGDYGGSIDRILRGAGKFSASSNEQLQTESKAIQEAGPNLRNAIYTNADRVSKSVQDLFDGVYARAKNGVADAVKALPTTLAQGGSLLRTIGGSITDIGPIVVPKILVDPKFSPYLIGGPIQT